MIIKIVEGAGSTFPLTTLDGFLFFLDLEMLLLLLLMGTVTGTVSVVPSRFKIVTVSKAELEDAG
jgi:hypothetical protein